MRGSQTTISSPANAQVERGVAAEVLVGEEEDALARARTPTRATARAFDEVQTMPPSRPQNAFRLAAEFM